MQILNLEPVACGSGSGLFNWAGAHFRFRLRLRFHLRRITRLRINKWFQMFVSVCVSISDSTLGFSCLYVFNKFDKTYSKYHFCTRSRSRSRSRPKTEDPERWLQLKLLLKLNVSQVLFYKLFVFPTFEIKLIQFSPGSKDSKINKTIITVYVFRSCLQ